MGKGGSGSGLVLRQSSWRLVDGTEPETNPALTLIAIFPDMRWIDTQLEEHASQHREAFWANHRIAIQGDSFWANKIKELKDEPNARLELALDNLPLPGAFRQAAIALRALIRDAKKEGHDWKPLLQNLYQMAAYESFMIDYAPRLLQPGYNVMESVPGKTVASLQFTYERLGYRELRLLNKTDAKWLVDVWGEPKKHTTLNAMHKATWDHYEDILIQKMTSDNNQFKSEISKLFDEHRKNSVQATLQPKQKWWRFW